jgi:hypothetical protein
LGDFQHRCECSLNPQQGGDFNGNGRVDFDDIQSFQNQLGSLGLTSDGLMLALDRYLSTVPEPSSGLLLICSVCGVALRRNRRYFRVGKTK